MKISCSFPSTMSSPEDVRIAEQIGYERAWLYDTPALCCDVWMSLAMAAERTSRIGLGPAVLVPTLRHPMTNTPSWLSATARPFGPKAPIRMGTSIGRRGAMPSA